MRQIDNNLVENAICLRHRLTVPAPFGPLRWLSQPPTGGVGCPTVLGKKNWLFIGAILYTIIESCRRRAIDPFAYLRDVLTRLPTATNRQVPSLTPEAWAKALRARKTLAFAA